MTTVAHEPDLADLTLAALAGWVRGGLRAELEHRPDSERGLTALADLAVLTSALPAGDAGAAGVQALQAGLRSLLAGPAAPERSGPGPPGWARHAAAAWTEPDRERARLRDPAYASVVRECEHAVRGLGPAWRDLEVAHVAARLDGGTLPRLDLSGSTGANAYHACHAVLYATDLGRRPPDDDIAALVIRRHLVARGDRPGNPPAPAPPDQDVVLELLLARRCLHQSCGWAVPAAPGWVHDLAAAAVGEQALDGDRAWPTYHALALSALVLTPAADRGGTSERQR